MNAERGLSGALKEIPIGFVIALVVLRVCIGVAAVPGGHLVCRLIIPRLAQYRYDLMASKAGVSA